MLSDDWMAELRPEFAKPYYKNLYDKVNEEYRTHVVYPAGSELFSAFELTPLSEVKVVILGQDPYHEPGQAHGLSFSVKPGIEIPPSLRNIYLELGQELGCYYPDNGYLVPWAKQGVLLLNTLLTVRAHEAFSHKGIGWEQFTDAAISGHATSILSQTGSSRSTGRSRTSGILPQRRRIPGKEERKEK